MFLTRRLSGRDNVAMQCSYKTGYVEGPDGPGNCRGNCGGCGCGGCGCGCGGGGDNGKMKMEVVELFRNPYHPESVPSL